MEKAPSKIDQLAALFEKENEWVDSRITILPNGEIRAEGDFKTSELKPGQKPLTFRENLGGEYSSL